MKGKLIPAAVIKLLWEKFTMKVKIQIRVLCSQLSFYTLFVRWLQGNRDAEICLATVLFAYHHYSHPKRFESYFVYSAIYFNMERTLSC